MCNKLCACSIVAGSVLVPMIASAPEPQLSGVPACLHDRAEQADDRRRREAALALAKAINERQGIAAERTRLYVQLAQLRNLPPTPRGFDVRLYTDGVGYLLSIKDTMDPCKYAIFSDQAGLVYEQAPLAAPFLARRR